MLEAFRSIANLLKYRRIHIDGNIFRIHYTITVILLLAFCVIVTTKQFAGEPIMCESHGITPNDLLNYYCFIGTTYIVKNALGLKVGKDVPAPGVIQSKPNDDQEDLKYQTYYQWVCFVLFIQAIFFYIPRWLWKIWEGGKMKGLVMDLKVACIDGETRSKKKDLMVAYFSQSTRGHNDWYAIKYFFCEFLAFVNVITQMYFLDWFFDGEFWDYGSNVIKFSQGDPSINVDPMIQLFPRMTKCYFYKYGPSGNLENVDSICLLPINIINEKIFIFIWFWFYILAIITFMQLICRLLIVAFPFFRCVIFRLRFGRILNLDNGWINHLILHKLYLGDWLILIMLGQNIDSLVFHDVISDLLSGNNALLSQDERSQYIILNDQESRKERKRKSKFDEVDDNMSDEKKKGWWNKLNKMYSQHINLE